MLYKIILIAILFFASPVWAINWYVDNTASGSNNGTSWTNAWQSFATISWASVNAGDTVYISGGSTFKTYTEQLTIGASGSSGNPITVKVGQDTGHTGTVILDNSDASAIRGIDISSRSYVTISGQIGAGTDPNMIVRNHQNNEIRLSVPIGVDLSYIEVGPHTYDGGGANDDCIRVEQYLGGGNRIHHNKIHNCFDYGINPQPPTGDITSDTHLIIDYNEIYNLGHDAIHAGARAGGLTIDRNIIHTAISGSLQSPTYIDGMHLRGLHHLTVSNNVIYNLENSEDGMFSYIYIECDSIQLNVNANDIKIFNNLIYETTQTGITSSHAGISFGCKECATMTRVYILNNTIVDVDDWALDFGSYNATVSNTIIANNIFYNGAYEDIGSNRLFAALRYLDAVGGVTVGSMGDSPIPDIIWDYNLIDVGNSDTIQYRYGTSLGTLYTGHANFRSACNCDNSGVNTDPSFVSWTPGDGGDFHLANNDTSAMNTGYNFSSYFTTDIDGTSRPQGSSWDIGAYEYIQSTTCTTCRGHNFNKGEFNGGFQQ